MAYGFGTSEGTGASDRLDLTLTAPPGGPMTVAAWVYWVNAGPSNQGHLYLFGTAGGVLYEGIYNNGSTGVLRFERSHTSAPGRWHSPAIDAYANTWLHIALTYDDSSTDNDPQWYLAGSAVTTTENQAPSGTVRALLTASAVLGNRKAYDRNWGGRIAHWARWQRILSADEIYGLAKHNSPLYLRDGLLYYHPLIRGLYDVKGYSTAVNTGALVKDGPFVRQLRNQSRIYSLALSAAAPLVIDVGSISSGEAFGTPDVLLEVPPGSISSGEAFGTPDVLLEVTPGSISSGETFGTPDVILEVTLGSISTGEAFGTPDVMLEVTPGSIPSGEAFGTPEIVTPGVITPGSISSGEAFGTPDVILEVALGSISTGEAFGTPAPLLEVMPGSIPSGEAFGTPVIVLSGSGDDLEYAVATWAYQGEPVAAWTYQGEPVAEVVEG